MEMDRRGAVPWGAAMPSLRRVAVTLLLVPVVCAPLAVVTTILCAPFWEWFEAATAIQSYGHHGPAEWCYLVTFAALVAAGCALAFMAGRRPAPPA